MDNQKMQAQCCIAGGGPAGIMLGFLLARAGIKTIVLEKWPDFFRDFRGDTIHPSTMELLHQLGLLQEFLKLPHSQSDHLNADIASTHVCMADFSHLKVQCPFIAFIPQWDFLNFISAHARPLKNFQLLMNTEATDLIEENKVVIGVRAKDKEKEFEILADLVVGADGRHSLVRDKSGLNIQSLSAPMDVLWFRLSRKATDPLQSLGKIDLGRILIMIERNDYWQCGFLIPKDTFETVRQEGIEAFQQSIVAIAPTLVDRVSEITSWDQVKLLQVTVNRLEKWYRPGLMCIGDAAHAMSPIGGVGINLAIQDAVASANILAPIFWQGKPTEADLARIQKRRVFATRITQGIQVFIQNNVVRKVLGKAFHPKVPLMVKLMQKFPFLCRFPAYLIGMGVTPERISAELLAAQKKE